ncbi:type II toxin-antitoxin system RelE/ParE family toxin [Chamaesiphon sp. VAR_48_metabat_403]|uniref:type II toxin-antitoxin system RelE family toxin n=1 Tax=Chamaesiphon sp. VAR_48_metabat_403 TaxID=2964700 RepID=UPI00286DCE69|nr:type II toxin-antitoxin system RelE/ParE family toxin [Chamaesiphon sp. VAR_48_metabat_403]
MSYSVEFTSLGIASLEDLNQSIQQRVVRKIRWLSENFNDVNPQSLTADLSGLFKLRVGDYRVIYSFNIELQVIAIHKIGHRRDVYN